MWILKWLPDWFFYGILVVGIIGLISTYLVKFLAKFIPPLYMYKTPIQLVSIAFIILGVFMSGAIYNNDQWEAKIKELQEKVKLAEEKSKEVNTQIETQVIEKTKVIREKGKTQIEYINRLVEGKTVEIVKDMSAEERAAFEKKQKELQDALKNCPVPKIIVEELNKATEQK